MSNEQLIPPPHPENRRYRHYHWNKVAQVLCKEILNLSAEVVDVAGRQNVEAKRHGKKHNWNWKKQRFHEAWYAIMRTFGVHNFSYCKVREYEKYQKY